MRFGLPRLFKELVGRGVVLRAQRSAATRRLPPASVTQRSVVIDNWRMVSASPTGMVAACRRVVHVG
ncbi:Uncharacterised protein [Mycobacteroides abscessus subsp. abscessus]|nr:Uncharacterised protein [Mycobacteroides abscessus subsp. abscessus]